MVSYISSGGDSMQILHLTQEDLNNMKKFKPNDPSENSTLYLKDGELYKIFHGISEIDEQEDNIHLWSSKKTIKFKPTKKIYVSNRFKGVAFNYYKNAQSFLQTLNNTNISLEQRMNLIKLFINELKTIHIENCAHNDLLLGNILIVDNDIRIVDMEELSDESDNITDDIKDFTKMILLYVNKENNNNFKNHYYMWLNMMNELYKKQTLTFDQQYDIYNSALVSLSYIYRVNFEPVILENEIILKEIVKMLSLDNNLKEYLLTALFEPHNIDGYIDEHLNKIDERDIQFDRQFLLKRYVK